MALPFSQMKPNPVAIAKRHRICKVIRLSSHYEGINKLKPYSYSKRTLPVNCTLAPINEPKSEVMSSIEESDVGITCFISHLPGFRGILKQRYADFIVNEIDLGGNVVHLTSLVAPSELAEEKKVKITDQPNKSYAHEIESFRALAGDSDADTLKAFIDKSSSGADDSVGHITLSPSSDKSHRTAMHNFFKENLRFLITDTVDGPDTSSKCIRVRSNSGGNTGRDGNSKKRKQRSDKTYDSRGSNNWPEHLGKFIRFHLYKENKDTQEALGVIGKMLGIQPRSFGFAGTKDKRSVSTQRVTLFKLRASRLAALNDRLIGIKVGDFCHVNEGLLLGQLSGNRFTITLRGVVADSDDTLQASLDALGRHGFINYFGLQRFGSGSVPTHLIGAALFQGQWKDAVRLILDPRKVEKDYIREVREYYKESNDIEGTLRKLPRNLVAERAILQCLKNCPGNYLQALKAIPRTLRMMYGESSKQLFFTTMAAATFELSNLGFRFRPLSTFNRITISSRRVLRFVKSLKNRTINQRVSCSLVGEENKVEHVSFSEEENSLIEALIGIQGRGRSASPKQLQDVERAVQVLEGSVGVLSPTSSSLIEGRWQLMFTTRPGTASPIQRTFVGVDFFSVFQEVYLQTKDQRVSNIVKFSDAIGELKVEAAASVKDEKRILFRFDKAAFSFKFLPFKVPYPVPFKLLGDEAKGWLDTTYLSQSGNLRISKGNKGTTFVLQKTTEPRQTLLSAISTDTKVRKAIEDFVNQNAAKGEQQLVEGEWDMIWSSQMETDSWIENAANGLMGSQIVKANGQMKFLVDMVLGLKFSINGTYVKSGTNLYELTMDDAAILAGGYGLPVEIGSKFNLEVLYSDAKLRITEGYKNTIFVHVRVDGAKK